MENDPLCRLIVEFGDDTNYYEQCPRLSAKLAGVLETREDDVLDTILLSVENLTYKIEAYSHLLKRICSFDNELIERTSYRILRELKRTLLAKQFHHFSALVFIFLIIKINSFLLFLKFFIKI